MKLSSKLLLSLFFVSTLASADQSIHCPALDKVKATSHLLDTVANNPSQPGTYVVSTAHAVIHEEHNWMVYTAPVTANDSAAALLVGQNNVRNTVRQDNQTAYPFGPSYTCIYWSNLYAPVIAVMES